MRRTRRGFTLLELLVVLGIIALLMTLVAPKFLGQLGAAKPKVTKNQITNTVTAIEMFHIDVGRYPTTEEGLAILVDTKGLAGAKPNYFAKLGIPKDGWGEPLQYRVPASQANVEFEVYSLGADKKPGGEGDNKDLYSWAAD